MVVSRNCINLGSSLALNFLVFSNTKLKKGRNAMLIYIQSNPTEINGLSQGVNQQRIQQKSRRQRYTAKPAKLPTVLGQHL